LQDLGFYDGHQTVGLADGGLAGQSVCSLFDRSLGRKALADLEHCAPLCESAPALLVQLAEFCQLVDSLGVLLAVGAGDVAKASVHFDACNDSCVANLVDEVCPVFARLGRGLSIQNHTTDEFVEALGLE